MEKGKKLLRSPVKKTYRFGALRETVKIIVGSKNHRGNQGKKKGKGGKEQFPKPMTS